MPGTDIGAQLLKGQRRQLILTVAIYAIVFAAIGYVWVDSMQTRKALCTFRADLVQRVETSRAYLADHPHGLAGISATSIQSSIDNQQRTIDSLAGLNCKPTGATSG